MTEQHSDEEAWDACIEYSRQRSEEEERQIHTPEPWGLGPDGLICRGENITIADVMGAGEGDPRGPKYPQPKANAVRIVACVNYCAGLSNEELESDAISMKSKAGILAFTPEEAAYLLAAGRACSKAGLADPAAEIERLLSRENAVIVEQQAEIEGLRAKCKRWQNNALSKSERIGNLNTEITALNAAIHDQGLENTALRARITEPEAAIRQSNFPEEGHFPDLT